LANLEKSALLVNQGRTLCKAAGFNFANENDVIAFGVLASVTAFEPRQSTFQNRQA
jgi:hypothetical protein